MTIAHLRSCLFVLLLSCAAAWGASPPRTHALRIDAQPLAAALQAFADQSGVQVMFFTELSKGLKAKPLVGSFTTEQALRALLDGTGLGYTFVNERTVSIRAVASGREGKSENGRTSGLSSADEALLLADAGAHTVTRSGGRDANDVEEMLVEGERDKAAPFSDRNVDLARSKDDEQPYYIFDATTIQRSGATSIEDFMKQRLTMNTVALSNAQAAGDTGVAGRLGATSSVNLRGLGTTHTLILVNGRRMSGVRMQDQDYQPDLNGIPLSAIDRIEVLPASASGIYGASALGGVVNVILKQSYSGGEIRAAYDNAWGADAPVRTLSGTFGTGFEGGRSQLMLSTQWSDAESLLLQDRREVFDRGLAVILRNNPAQLYGNIDPFAGSLPNIASAVGPVQIIDGAAAGTNLVLKDGRPLNSHITHIPAGTSTSTSATQLYDALLANAGQWNLNLPASTQSPTGLLRPFGVAPERLSAQVTLRRQMFPGLGAFLELGYAKNHSTSLLNPAGNSSITVNSAASTNPFRQRVTVRIPVTDDVPFTTGSVTRSLTAGAVARLPYAWNAEFDFSWSKNDFDFRFYSYDTVAQNADLNNGTLNLFVDTILNPPNLTKYLYSQSYSGSSQLQDWALRSAGPLPLWPLGEPRAAIGLEHRIATTPENEFEQAYPITLSESLRVRYFAQKQTTDSAYGEIQLPLVPADKYPFLKSLELQAAGRAERYTVGTGTTDMRTYYNRTPPLVVYNGYTLDEQPYFSRESYTSANYTLGIKYSPLRGLTLRASTASAFLPPRPTDLYRNPVIDPSQVEIYDPVLDDRYLVQTASGGNPDLRPQNSRSFNAGLIWEPQWDSLRGLRFNAEYYRIDQFDAIGSLTLQQFVDLDDTYGRVTRDDTGRITVVDLSAVNLYRLGTQGWDLSVDHRLSTPAGDFDMHLVGSMILGLKQQYSLGLPELDAVNFPSEGGAARYKSNLQLAWARNAWAAGWTMRYFGAYKQNGAAGGPLSVRYHAGGIYPLYINSQGSQTISDQLYHDVFVGYAFGDSGARAAGRVSGVLQGMNVQVGVRNVFGTLPPFDAYYSNNYFASPYGDVRLRSYSLSLQKSF